MARTAQLQWLYQILVCLHIQVFRLTHATFLLLGTAPDYGRELYDLAYFVYIYIPGTLFINIVDRCLPPKKNFSIIFPFFLSMLSVSRPVPFSTLSVKGLKCCFRHISFLISQGRGSEATEAVFRL